MMATYNLILLYRTKHFNDVLKAIMYVLRASNIAHFVPYHFVTVFTV